MSKRLLFITPIFPKKLEEDYVVPFLAQFTYVFAEQTDVVVDVISLAYPFEKIEYKLNNVTVYAIGSKFISPIKQFPFMLRAVYKGVRLHKKNKYDGVLCFWYREAALVGVLLNKLLGLKLRVWFLGQDVQKGNKYIPLLRISPKKLIMISKQQREIFYKNHNIFIDKIANVAFDRKKFPELNKDERPIDIIGVGNIGFIKNYALFLDIIIVLREFFPNLRAVICGADAGQKPLLDKKVQENQLEQNITFTGRISLTEVYDYMNKSRVFLHTSNAEGAGLVLQEALYLGCKVVSTIEVEESDEIKNHFFFSKDTDVLTNNIKEYLNNPFEPVRIERFKMEDTIQCIYESFFN
ncbi:glycosyltransferase involved in cell wall biosynthesis [Tenacibaculum skagerrakense]|uniref:Glycosyltransferase involved in cell wall biosynthesis n=1 Tax=Tenacibaculum skagerrakense TaxID=186571 RepID=A0A4R2P2T2_9FLAO|nr:glycosyltransferase [Tenacibaculum skagerrakense]TCP28284.1 glycosyltransferase involved in cell wall biosynthesis [Tenacibaculum skagerrakense]